MRDYDKITDWVIYKITSPSNRIYIGQSTQIDYRWNQYKYCNNTYNNYNPLINRSFLKYGWENHKFEIIEECDINILDEREIFWIKKYKNDGFNLTNHTDGGDTYYYEDKIKLIAESNKILKKGNKYCLGHKHSEKTKKRISEAVKNSNHPHYGIPKPDYIRKKISIANSGKKNGMYGNHFEMSDSHKDNISKALKASKKFQSVMKSDEFRQKISNTQINPVLLLDGEFNIFKEFKNMAECSRYLNCSPENVYNARRDKRKVKKKYWVVYPEELNDFKNHKL